MCIINKQKKRRIYVNIIVQYLIIINIIFCKNCRIVYFVDQCCPISSHNDPSPATGVACSTSMDVKFSCNCVDKTATSRCAGCNAGVCNACVKTYYLQGTTCERCAAGCSTCSSNTVCSECIPGFKLVGDVCEIVCTKPGQCQAGKYCDFPTKECKPCSDDCTDCASPTVCGACKQATQYPDITGKCHENCTGLTNNQYCKDGVAEACGAGINSPCKCNLSASCASCTSDGQKCETCLPGFKLNAGSGSCLQCLDGYFPVTSICVKISVGGSTSGDKLSGGAIAGIVIASLVVVGGVGGGLAYYFIKKNKR